MYSESRQSVEELRPDFDSPVASPDVKAGWLGLSYWRWTWLLAAVGVLFRLRQYFFDRSVWLDEAMMAQNIVHRSFQGLTKPLDFHLVGPLLWLFLEKSCGVLFGYSDLSLRITVIVMGVVAVLVLPFIARLVLPLEMAPVAVGLFAFSPPLIYYASELKPYGSDAGFCAVTWLIALWAVLPRQVSWPRIVVLALWGAIVTWCSHPSLFVLGGIGATVVVACLIERNWKRLVAFIPAFLAWATSFGFEYFYTLRGSSKDVTLLHSYPFVNLPSKHFSDVEAVLQCVFAQQQNPLTLLLGVAILGFILGCIFFWQRNRSVLFILLLPLIFALIASNFHHYPLMGRFYMFFTPALVIMIAAGAEAVRQSTQFAKIPIATAFLVLLFFQPVFSTTEVVLHPMQAEELKPVIQYVLKHEKPGDVWYVYCYGQHAFDYYAGLYGLNNGTRKIVLGSCFRQGWLKPGVVRYDWDMFNEDFSKLKPQHVWAIFTHTWTGDGVNELTLGLRSLNQMGTQRDQHIAPGASAYLFDLGTPPPPLPPPPPRRN
jgi:hypothetical protein